MAILAREATLLFLFCLPSQWRSTLKERICSCRSKFFPLTVDPIKSRSSYLEELVLPQKETGSHQSCLLTLKAPITTAADDIHKYFIALSSSKDKSKKLNVVCCNFCLAL